MSLLNRSAVKRAAVNLSDIHRNGKFTRVSEEFVQKAEAALKVWMVGYISRHPSIGKTIK